MNRAYHLLLCFKVCNKDAYYSAIYPFVIDKYDKDHDIYCIRYKNLYSMTISNYVPNQDLITLFQ